MPCNISPPNWRRSPNSGDVAAVVLGRTRSYRGNRLTQHGARAGVYVQPHTSGAGTYWLDGVVEKDVWKPRVGTYFEGICCQLPLLALQTVACCANMDSFFHRCMLLSLSWPESLDLSCSVSSHPSHRKHHRQTCRFCINTEGVAILESDVTSHRLVPDSVVTLYTVWFLFYYYNYCCYSYNI